MSGTNRKMKGCGFHHVFMRVKDLDTSIKFYAEGLGFSERFSWRTDQKRSVLMDTGDGNYFEISQGEAHQAVVEGVFRHVALRVDDCTAALARARNAGAEVIAEVRDVTLSTTPPLQIRVAFFKGPDGELVELFEDNQT
jgi:glyoxylase I family protein